MHSAIAAPCLQLICHRRHPTRLYEILKKPILNICWTCVTSYAQLVLRASTSGHFCNQLETALKKPSLRDPFHSRTTISSDLKSSDCAWTPLIADIITRKYAKYACVNSPFEGCREQINLCVSARWLLRGGRPPPVNRTAMRYLCFNYRKVVVQSINETLRRPDKRSWKSMRWWGTLMASIATRAYIVYSINDTLYNV